MGDVTVLIFHGTKEATGEDCEEEVINLCSMVDKKYKYRTPSIIAPHLSL